MDTGAPLDQPPIDESDAKRIVDLEGRVLATSVACGFIDAQGIPAHLDRLKHALASQGSDMSDAAVTAFFDQAYQAVMADADHHPEGYGPGCLALGRLGSEDQTHFP